MVLGLVLGGRPLDSKLDGFFGMGKNQPSQRLEVFVGLSNGVHHKYLVT